MNGTFSAIVAATVILGASTVPAFAPENKHRPLRRKINSYLGAAAVWSVIVIGIGSAFWFTTASADSKNAIWAIIQPAIFILIPSFITAVAMKLIDRSPSIRS